MADLSNKLAIITGAGSGIGEAIARRFVEAGATIVILDQNEEAAEALAAELDSPGDSTRAFAHAVDVSDHESVSDVFSGVVEELGAPDILVNNAGIAHVGKLDDTTPEDFDRLFSVNVRGVYNCLHAAIRPMVKNGGGVILNMASCAAKIGIPDRFAYSMTKGAVMNMTLSVARDYVEDNIRSNCLCPARVHTPFVDNYIRKNYPGEEKKMFAKLSATQPIGRMGKPEEIAELAAFVCSDAAAFITGSAFDIDGGFTLLR